MEARCETTPLALKHKHCKPLIICPNWVTASWKYLHTCQATIDVTPQWAPKKSRIHDIAIMMALTDPTTGLSTKYIRTINRCRLYLLVFFLSDIETLKGDAIALWSLPGIRSETRTSTWNWPIQQKPPKSAWKLWAKVLLEAFGDGNSLDVPLGSWLMDNNHQNNEWWLDSHSRSLYQYTKHTWVRYIATNYGRLRFHAAGTDMLPPNSLSHRVKILKRPRYLEITVKTRIAAREKEHIDRLHKYTSEVSPAFFEFPHHVQRLNGSIPDFITSRVYREGELMDIMIATEGSVLFGVGYHGWVISTRDEQILLSGGGPDGGSIDRQTSYIIPIGARQHHGRTGRTRHTFQTRPNQYQISTIPVR
jgi:hypothetical protein